jgi:hypothetical protein
VRGDRDDIFICTPTSLGMHTACDYRFFWDGTAAGLQGTGSIDALWIGPAVELSAVHAAGIDANAALDSDIPEEEAPEMDDDLSDADHAADDVSAGEENQSVVIFIPLVTGE